MGPLHHFTSRSKLLAALALTLAAGLMTLGLEFTSLTQAYRLKTLDLLFRHVPLEPASPEIVVVTVDQPDLECFKDRVTWPWPRQLYAPILDFCRRAGARAVIMDILFTEASSYGPEDDQRLARAEAEAGNVVMAGFLSRESKEPPPGEGEMLKKAGLTIPGAPPRGLPRYHSFLPPIPPLAAAAAGVGNVECQPDLDGIYRRVPLVAPYQGSWVPLLAFAAYHRLTGGSLRFEPGALVMGASHLPLDGEGKFLLKFRGPARSHRRYAAANIIQSEYLLSQGKPPLEGYAPESFRGKWVLLGLTAPGLLDLKACPVGAVYPGVELHATLLDNLIQGDFLRPAPSWLLWAWTLILAGAVCLMVLFSPGLAATLGSLAFLAFACLAAAVISFRLSWWADPVLPGTALALAFALATAYSYATEGRQKQYIRRMFAHYMSDTVISHLLKHPEKLKLGGERRRVTLFFSDLAGFTTLSEQMPPETVVGLLNQYLSRMTGIILEEGGTVDKFEGDAIMAFWGAPLDQENQALRACRAALRQHAALKELNGEFARQGLPPLTVRIGLHTGEAVVGNLGSQDRFDYTVIGDTVNLASRLEGINKFYRTTIMASESTVAECAGLVEVRELDSVAVKGRETPVGVFQVLALKGELPPQEAAARGEFARGLELYRGREFSQAAAAFAGILQNLPEDGPSQVFLERCRDLEAHPPPTGWDSVFRPDKK